MGMNCLEIRERIRNCGTPAGSLDVEWDAHLESCELCRHWYADLVLDSALAGFQTPEPRAGFVDRVMDSATRDARRRTNSPVLALAASIAFIGIAIGLFLGRGQTSDVVFEVAMAPYQERLVEVVIATAAEREQTTLTIALPDGLELTGFPDQRAVRWQADLAAGKNLLALPLVLTGEADTHFTVHMNYGSTERILRVDVRAEPQTDQQISA